jgi:hypothetical protein
MDELKSNWLTEGLIDFEYKKYQLLAYLQKVKQSFGRVELYPFLSDLVFHYRNLKSISENKELIQEAFPKEISFEKLKDLELTYKKIVEDDSIMKEIEDIISFSLPRVKDHLDEGSFIYEYVESQCEISPVGLSSLYAQEGYLFISQPPQKEADIFRYQVTIFEQSSETMRGINTQFIYNTERNLTNTFEQIKLKLIKEFSDIPNPSTYLITTKLKFPFEETLMPVAKRLLVKYLAKAA